jgi:hypothetical protein
VVVTYFSTLTVVGAIKLISFVAMTAYGVQQSRKMKKALASAMSDSQDRKVMVRDNLAPRRVIYGTIKVSGPLALMHATGATNQYLHLVIMVASHEVDSFVKLFVNQEEVTVDGSGMVTTGRFANKVRLRTHNGADDQAADSVLISEAPGIWTTNHRLRGIAYIYARIEFDQTAFPNGLPNISALVRGKKLYDPRTSTTAFSNNAALVIADYIALQGGLNVPFADIDADELIAAANICDEQIELSDGVTNESRYLINGSVTTDQSPAEVLEGLRMAMAGAVVYSGGKWFIQAGAYRTPSVDLDEGDMHGPVTVNTRVSKRDNFNAVKGVMVSEADDYALIEFPSVTNSTYTAWDGGEVQWKDVEYPYTTSSATAQRLAKIDLERGRQQITVQALFSMKAMKARAGSTIRLSFARYGWVNKVFDVIEWTFKTYDDANGNPALAVEMSLQETAPGVWDWNDGEETTLDLAPNTLLPSSYTGLGVSALTVQSGTSHLLATKDGTIVPRLFITWTGPANIFVQKGGSYLVQVKQSSSSDWIEAGRVDGGMTFIYYAEVVEGINYDVRVRASNIQGAEGDWATVTGHTVVGKSAAPNPPNSLTATGASDGIYLKWNNPSDADLAEIQIYEHTASTPAPNSGSTPYATTSASSFFRGGLGLGVTRYYWLRSRDTSGNFSSWVGPASASTSTAGTDTVPPGDPTDITVTAGFGTLWVKWTNPPDSDLRHIRIFESATTSQPSTPSYLSATNFFASGPLADGVTRYFWLQSEDTSGNRGNVVGYVSGTTVAGITLDNLVPGLTVVQIVSSLPGTGDPDNPVVFLSTDKQLYRWDATAGAWTKAVAAVDVTGQLTNAQIADLAAAKLTGTITTTQIADDAISTPKLAAGSVVAGKIATEAVTAEKIAANAVTADKVDAGAITAGKLAANSVTAGVIEAGAIVADAIGTNQIITYAANIADAVITDAKIYDLSASKITAGTIGAHEITMDGGSSILKSSNYSAGSAGFQIKGNGDAEFNNGTFRGLIAAGQISHAVTFIRDPGGSEGGQIFLEPPSGYSGSWGMDVYSDNSLRFFVEGGSQQPIRMSCTFLDLDGSGVIKINGTQVVGAQHAAIASLSPGGSNNKINEILSALRHHGLIAT